jgi:hypothetical protein
VNGLHVLPTVLSVGESEASLGPDGPESVGTVRFAAQAPFTAGMLIRELEKAGFDRDQIREELGL